ncbi:hypothetical protein [Vibrio sp. PNB23_22_7]
MIIHKKEHILSAAMFLMGSMVIAFNVAGYDLLFFDEPWIPFIPVSPFGLLLGVTEIAVLIWTQFVLSRWLSVGRFLKVCTFVLVPAFAFLCYSGINSYLSTLATSDIAKANEARLISENNAAYIKSLEREVATLEEQITEVRAQIVPKTEDITSKSEIIKSLSEQASERRLKGGRVCADNPDCAAAVENFQSQIDMLTREVKDIGDSRRHDEDRLTRLEQHLYETQNKLRNEKISDRQSVNVHSGVESTFELKKQAYSSIIIGVAESIGVERPKDPFQVFVSFISALIYPVYFLLNLYLCMQSEEWVSHREKKKIFVERKWSIRNTLIKQLIKLVKLSIRKRIELKKELNNLYPKKEDLYKKGILRRVLKYYRVHAAKRQKVRKIVETIEVVKEIEVEKIVEVEKEVVKEVIKEVPVEVVRIEKIKEPMIVREPSIIIHERIVPVPEDASAEDIEDLLHETAKYRFDTLPTNSANEAVEEVLSTESRNDAETNAISSPDSRVKAS